MAQVAITVNGRTFQVACDDGQEKHLQDLAKYLNTKVDALASQVGQIGDLRLMLMASLMITDELHDAKAQIKSGGGKPADDSKVTAMLSTISKRLSGLADKAEEKTKENA